MWLASPRLSANCTGTEVAFLPKDPRLADKGNRTFFESIWMFEWGIIFALLHGGMAWTAFVVYDKTGSEIAIVTGAAMVFLLTFGGWALQVYKSGSVAKTVSNNTPPQPGDGGTP